MTIATLKADIRYLNEFELGRFRYALHYQPKVDVVTGAIVSAEALLRVIDNTGVSADTFTHVCAAEHDGRIHEIGTWVFQAASRDLAVIIDQGFKGFHVSVNLSPRQADHEGLSDMVMKAVDQYQVPTQALELEITESWKMQLLHIEHVKRLKDGGFSILLDDFGTDRKSVV